MRRPGDKRERKRFPDDSIAGFVFDPALPHTAPALAPMVGFAPGSIAEAVFGRVRRHIRGRVVSVLIVLFGVSIAASLAASARAPKSMPAPTETRSTPTRVEYDVDLTPPEAPPAPEPETLAQAKQRVQTRKRLAKSSAPGAKPPPPAQAGEIVAKAEPSLDFTEDAFVTGQAPRFAGGVTALTGTNTDAVRTSTVDPNARPGGPQGEGSLARSVSLSARDWTCPWPDEAEMLGIDEQVVLIRALVDTAGKAKKVTILADPGHGFGKATLECAKSAQFQSARDAKGEPYTATSPPIRVRFTR